MKAGKISTIKRTSSKYRMRLITSIIIIVVGLIISGPFIIDIFILDNAYHYMTLGTVLELLGLIVGGPLLVGGLIGIFTRNSTGGSSSTASIDLGRIRYSVETEARKP